MFNRYAKKLGGLTWTDFRLNGVGPNGPIRDGVLIRKTYCVSGWNVCINTWLTWFKYWLLPAALNYIESFGPLCSAAGKAQSS